MTTSKPTPAQLRWCRAGFVICCVCPTIYVALWIVFRAATGAADAQLAEWQHTLSLQLGVNVSASSLDYPTFDTAVLSAVELRDGETGDLLASLRALEVTVGSDGTEVVLVDPVVTQAGSRSLLAITRDRVLRHQGPILPVKFVAHQLVIETPEGPWSVHNPEAWWHITQSGPELQLSFTPPEASTRADRPVVRVIASRNREMTPPVTRWQVDTGALSLPMSLVASVAPSFQRLGPSVAFSGSLSLFEEAEGLRGTLAGKLSHIDLDALITEQFPHTISGDATAVLERVVLERGRIASARGTLQAQHGQVSHSMLVALEEHLGATAAIDSRGMNPSQTTPYRQLAIGFHLDQQQLQLTGSCDPTRDGVMLAAASGPLVEVPQQHRSQPIALLRVLLPQADWQVPATQETGGLVALLPAPPLSQATATARAQQHVPTRLGPSGNRPAISEPR